MFTHFFGTALTVALMGLPGAALAQEDPDNSYRFGGDAYLAGATAAASAPVSGDLFAAGDRVTVDAPVSGSAHLAGRRVVVNDTVSGDIYAFGYRVAVEAPIGGNASISGAEVAVDAPVSGNLRVAGAELSISGNVGGAALVTGADVTIDGTISGAAAIAASELTFGPDAQIDGRFDVVTDDPQAIDVPDRVAEAARVTIRRADAADLNVSEEIREVGRRTARDVVVNLLLSVVVVVVFAALAVAIAPNFVARIRRTALARPARSVLAGFLTLSALIGAGIVLALTLIGLLLLPGALLLAAFSVFAGWVAGAYILGVALWQAFGHDVPKVLPRRAGLAALGALVAGLVAMVPVIGWIAWLVLVFLGLGGIVMVLLRPGENSPAPS